MATVSPHPFATGTPPQPPLVEQVRLDGDIEDVFRRIAGRQHVLFLDSALRHETLGRYSFLAADPFDFFHVPVTAPPGEFLRVLQQKLLPWRAATVAGLPPFQGGAAGLIAYDAHRQLERVDKPRWDEFGVPALAVGLYDVVLAADHATGEAWLISHGFPETDAARRRDRAAQRIAQWRRWLHAPPVAPPRQRSVPLRWDQLAPAHRVLGREGLWSDFSPDEYRHTIQRGIEYIFAGDVFQVNLAQRLLCAARDDSVALYLRLRRCNPATFAGYFDLGKFQIVSASPERFVRVHGGEVEARPIKGTRRRGSSPEADLFTGDELRESEKDRAENVMIVDLLRNDLSRVCRPESVRVTQLCRLETYEYVQHLVSAIRGRLREECDGLALLGAVFPGGSITGAPKVRAMQIIAELEPAARGAYCGTLGYWGFDGAMDSNLLIRTITAGRGWWQAPVGGGIVAASDPQREYEETWHKAEGLLQAMFTSGNAGTR